MILLDTDVISDLLRPNPNPDVEAWSQSVDQDEISTASLVEAELRAGIERMRDGRRKRTLEQDLDRFLIFALGGRVLPFDRAAARFYAEFVAARRRSGRPTSPQDALIAATARAHGATLLATRNTSDFEGCGVALVNPWDGP